uniref:Tail connector protein n=1 Tax=Siphoviridae sp. ctg6Y13 TaxID=2826419 RepID=A0A8S5QZ32_9CAUD|nr:MAG TPA: tail connector protein [Siphoviridae sp. ctg6Y13]
MVELTEIIDKVYEKIKAVSEVSLNEQKTKFIIESVIQDSVNYMNREDFPEELISPTAVYIYKYNFDKNRNIKSMKSGERQVEFVTGLNGDAEFRKSLNRFRKLGVVK